MLTRIERVWLPIRLQVVDVRRQFFRTKFDVFLLLLLQHSCRLVQQCHPVRIEEKKIVIG